MSADQSLPKWKTNLPNALTLLRVLLATGMFALLAAALSPPAPEDIELGLTGQRVVLLLATGLFILAAITDALDGHFARRWDVVSLFGRVMDPFADKLLILGSFVFMAGPAFVNSDGVNLTGIEPWMAVLILARELLVTTLRGVYERAGVDFSAKMVGKLKMVLQSAVIPAILLILAFSPANPGTPSRYAILALAWSVVIVTVWSGVPYIQRAMASKTTENQNP
jgi:CDP-diacylglycerol---glycerol-3-phosphate 3-phosphatidyltransferase